jgi:hypothetical protein
MILCTISEDIAEIPKLFRDIGIFETAQESLCEFA